MKKYFSKTIFATGFLVSVASLASCALPNLNDFESALMDGGKTDETKSESSKQEIQNNSFGAYSQDLLSLTHNIDKHWVFNVDHQIGQNGGFVLDVNNQGGILAETSVKGNNELSSFTKLVFSMQGQENCQVILILETNDSIRREITVQLTNSEADYELFIGGLDLSSDFKIFIKADENNQLSSLLVRDIHFSANLLKNSPTPYVDDNNIEFSLLDKYYKHWEINHDVENKYDNSIRFLIDENVSSNLFAKTTVAGSTNFNRFKSLVINLSTFKGGYYYEAKLRVGNNEYIINNTNSYKVISLEDIDTTKDFDIYFYPKTDDAQDSCLILNQLYLTSYETSPVSGNGLSKTFNPLNKAAYHWLIKENNSNEKLRFDNNKMIVDTKSTSSSNLTIYTTFDGIISNDFTKIRMVVKGVSGNKIKFSPTREAYQSYYSQYFNDVVLTGDEQVIEASFVNQSITGISIMPMADANNIAGDLEILSITYLEDDKSLKLRDFVNETNKDEIDITSDLIPLLNKGDNTTIDNNGHVQVQFDSGSSENLGFLIKRDSNFNDYYGVKIVYSTTGKFNDTVYTSESSSSSYGSDIVTNIKDCTIKGVNKKLDNSNLYVQLEPSSSGQATVTIYSISLIKEPGTYNDTSTSVFTNFKSYWRCAGEATVEADGVRLGVDSELPTRYFTNFKPTAAGKFVTLKIDFEAPEQDIVFTPKVSGTTTLGNTTIDSSMTSLTLNLNANTTWYTYNYYQIGFYLSTANTPTNLKITNITISK